jgi:hypothetical protein
MNSKKCVSDSGLKRFLEELTLPQTTGKNALLVD